MKLNVEKLKQGNIIKTQNGVQVDNTRTSVKEKVKPIPLNQEQHQNFKLYSSLNRPALSKIQNLKIVPDSTFTRDKTGQGYVLPEITVTAKKLNKTK